MVALAEAASVTAWAGLPLVVEVFRSLRLDEEVSARLRPGKRRRGFSEAEKLEALLLLLCAGGERVEDIRIEAEDRGLVRLLGQELPSPDALLDFLHAFHVEASKPEGQASWVPPESDGLRGLHDVNRALVARAAEAQATEATVDHDGTLIESNTEAATRTCEGFRGYQPLLTLWAEEALLVADEFRDGNVPGGEGPALARAAGLRGVAANGDGTPLPRGLRRLPPATAALPRRRGHRLHHQRGHGTGVGGRLQGPA
ncbi:MAG: transposase [Myxococcaceae bacterium]|nr:transposase [Myxococcaceae bacterium]MCA3011945.1 transposase [Myxococcaceae bacterium]